MKSIRTLITVLAATGALALAGVPAAIAQSGTGDSPSDSTAQTQKPHKAGGKRRGHKPPRLSDAQLTKVATALGTNLDALKAAETKVKAAMDATAARETPAQHDALLADELGVSVSDLRAAFESVRPARGDCPGHPAPSQDAPAGDTAPAT